MILTEMSVMKFVDEVLSANAVPGGGSVAALSGSLGASLLGMVCNITINKATRKGVEPDYEVSSALAKVSNAQRQFIGLIDSDSTAFSKVMDAFKLPKDSDEEKAARKIAIEEAYKLATKPPLAISELAFSLLETASILMVKGDKNALSDVKVAVKMLNSAVWGGVYNVEINLDGIKDDAFNAHMREMVTAITVTIDNKCCDILSLQ